jgi:hypothetical protein
MAPALRTACPERWKSYAVVGARLTWLVEETAFVRPSMGFTSD